MRFVLSTPWLFLLVEGACGQSEPRHEMQAPTVALTAPEVCLPMTFRGGRPIVEARLEGKGPYRFYLDTGASGPVIDQTLAQELELQVIGEAGVKSGGDGPDKKPIAAKLMHIESLELGGAKLSGVTIVAMDRARLGGNEAPVGVLSPAMFQGHLVTLDYPKKEVRIRAGQLGAPDDKTIFAYQEGRTIPSISATVGDQKIESHLDSGSGGSFSLPTKIAEKLPLVDKPRETGKRARSVSGDFPVLEAKLNGDLKFGQFTVHNPTIEFSDVVRRGNIGAGILTRFIVTLDVKNRRFQLLETK